MPPLLRCYALLVLGLTACTPGLGLRDPLAGAPPETPRAAPRTYGPGPRPAPAHGQEPRARVQVKDGSRLKNAWIDMPGGLRTPAYGPWDSQLRVRCSLGLDQAGDERCFPDVPGGRLRFLDERCLEPVLDTGADKPLSPGSMLEARVTHACNQTKTRVFRVGARVNPAPLWRQSEEGGSCRAEGAPAPGRTLYRAGEIVPPETFVRYRKRVLPGVGPLRPWIHAGEDGSVLDWGWMDLETGLECRPETAADGKVRCLPEVPDPSWAYYGDYTCGEEAFIAERGCRARAFAQTPAPGCPRRLGVRWRVPVERLYQRRDGQCQPVLGLRGGGLFGLGPEIPPDHFPPLEERMAAAPGRLRPVFIGAGDWEALWEFQDTQLDARCSWVVIGSMPTCIPSPTFISTFADPACRTPLGEYRGEQCPPANAVLPNPSGGYSLRAYRMGGAHPETPLYELRGDTCQPKPAEVGTRYFDLLPVSDRTFAPVNGRWTHVGR